MAQDIFSKDIFKFVSEKAKDRSAVITDSTPLITGGHLDSFAIFELVEFLETKFQIRFDAEDLTAAKLDTISAMVALLEVKVGRVAKAG